jgi:hypothetical protein
MVAPIQVAEGGSSGIAFMGSERDQTVSLALRDSEGKIVAQAEQQIPRQGHLARFIAEFEWEPELEALEFQGTVTVASDQEFRATVLYLGSHGMASLPVIPIS